MLARAVYVLSASDAINHLVDRCIYIFYDQHFPDFAITIKMKKKKVKKIAVIDARVTNNIYNYRERQLIVEQTQTDIFHCHERAKDYAHAIYI